jgi:hypothetical protein
MHLSRLIILCSIVLSIFGCAENPTLLPGVYILPVNSGKQLLSQCSRAVPNNITGFWSPTIKEVSYVDRNVDGYLDVRKSEGIGKSPRVSLSRYHRQYIGIIQAGKHLIYGNFYYVDPHYPGDFKNEASEPTIICDGGVYAFGIVYDLDDSQFVDVQFNGEV